MEGLYFDVKPRSPASSFTPTSKRSASAPSQLNLASSRLTTLAPLTSPLHLSPAGRKHDPIEDDEEVKYTLTLIGCLAVHPLTTMAMLPWVVAEIGRPQPGGPEWKLPVKQPGSPARERLSIRDQVVCISISASWVRCLWVEEVENASRPWDPLTHTHTSTHVLFECRPHLVTKLLHNSREPGSLVCLVRDAGLCHCYSFLCHNHAKVGWVCIRWLRG
ncbi:hypothetical protein UPYG_G00050060 [Umbra pygmaea]|uniref:Uncharacterized protein n=1 Tax=Umbra pygmaea TaxID=75934 RepID=A0ABD0XUC9_UMBPY